jgi:arginine-tRNA-protein transferase
MSHPESVQLADHECRLAVVQDHLQQCPYIDDVTARMPLQLPIGAVTPEVTDRLLELGYRRSGDFVYRTQCPSCNECKPTRVEVDRFKLTTSMKRVRKRGDRELRCEWGTPKVDAHRVWMFNQHRSVRGLGMSSEIDADSYRSFLFDTCCDTVELSIFRGEELISVSIVDAGRNSTSAVYTHFDPAASKYSLGTYAILKQIEWARDSGRKFVYLGMYVSSNSHLNYKSRFAPQQRLIAGEWVDCGAEATTQAVSLLIRSSSRPAK